MTRIAFSRQGDKLGGIAGDERGKTVCRVIFRRCGEGNAERRRKLIICVFSLKGNGDAVAVFQIFGDFEGISHRASCAVGALQGHLHLIIHRAVADGSEGLILRIGRYVDKNVAVALEALIAEGDIFQRIKLGDAGKILYLNFVLAELDLNIVGLFKSFGGFGGDVISSPFFSPEEGSSFTSTK